MHDPEKPERFMAAAIDEALAAVEHGDVPVGAVVVHNGRIIGRGHNERERLQDPTAHAEIVAITAAATYLESWRLDGCDLYVTLEPCCMCAGAIVLARMRRVLFGASDPKGGACHSLYHILEDERLNHRVPFESGILGRECGELLTEFFSKQRAMGKK